MNYRAVTSQVLVMVFHHGIVIRVDASLSVGYLVFQVIQPIASGLQPFVVPTVVFQLGLGYQRQIKLSLTTLCWAVLLDGFIRVPPSSVIKV